MDFALSPGYLEAVVDVFHVFWKSMGFRWLRTVILWLSWRNSFLSSICPNSGCPTRMI